MLPLAAFVIQDVRRASEALLAPDRAALRLLEINFQTKERLLALGCCYAAIVEREVIEPLVAVMVRWGMLFTLIDTVIDEGEIQDRAGCERLAGWLLSPLAPAPSVAEREALPLLDQLLAQLGAEIHARLSNLKTFPLLSETLRPLLSRHARLVVFQHIPAAEREAYLRESGIDQYEDLCVDGSPGPIFALIQAALQLGPRFSLRTVAEIEAMYFPEFGLVHVWTDDLADYLADAAHKGLNLARRAVTQGEPLGAEFLVLVAMYLDRLSGLPHRAEVLFPLRLLLEEYFKQAQDAVGQSNRVAVSILEQATQQLRRAYLVEWP